MNHCLYCGKEIFDESGREASKFCCQAHYQMYKRLGVQTYFGLWLNDREIEYSDFAEHMSEYMKTSSRTVWDYANKGITVKNGNETVGKAISYAVYDVDPSMRWMDRMDFDWRLLFNAGEVGDMVLYKELSEETYGMRVLFKHFGVRFKDLVEYVKVRMNSYECNQPPYSADLCAMQLVKALNRFGKGKDLKILEVSVGWANILRNMWKDYKELPSVEVAYWLGEVFNQMGHLVDYRLFLPKYNAQYIYKLKRSRK